MSYLPFGDNETPGVQELFAPQSTDAAARQALQEQKFGDEFKPQTSPDVDALVTRLNDLTTEQSNLCMQLYGPMTMMSGPYKGPPYMERARIQKRLDDVEDEICDIKAELMDYVDNAGLNVETGSPFMGNATVIGAS